MPLDPRSFKNDDFSRWAEEPPTPADGSLVPGSQFHEEQWIMAAGMLARGSSFLYVARAMGCSRTALWRAYYGSQDFRHRVWWERQALNREADLRLSSLRILVVEQIERLVSGGDPATIRWLADRLGLLTASDSRPLRQTDRDVGRGMDAGMGQAVPPHALPDAPAVYVPDLDDDVPGALRERRPPDPRAVAAVLAQPEAAGPKGLYPWTVNPDDPFPNLAGGPDSRRGRCAFGRRE